MNDIIERLQDKNDSEAHKLLLELEAKSAESNQLYGYFTEFAELTKHKSSFVRARGFRLCCAQAQWDTENKLSSYMQALLVMLSDDKPTAVRQCISALRKVIVYKPELYSMIAEGLKNVPLSKYKDTLRPLIKKDIEELNAFERSNRHLQGLDI